VKTQPVVDIGILTIRDDEFRAVLSVFPSNPKIYKGRHREYSLRAADAGEGRHYTVAVLRQVEQGNGEAQEAARDLIDDLQPSLVLLVGIAGGLPSDDISLGDVVLSTRILDFSLEARKFQDDTTYNVGGGPISKQIATGVANLSARESELGDWWAALPQRPPVSFAAGKLYGPRAWQKNVRESLQAHFGKLVPARHPYFAAGPIAASDRLIKDPELLVPWITSARGILAVEMESAGVHRTTRDRTPMLSIRALSDIVGLKRQDAWTKYACASAAAFACAYLRTQPIPLKTSTEAKASVPSPKGPDEEDADVREGGYEESFANLILLRHFPEALYVAPAHASNRKSVWAQFNQDSSKTEHVPNAWTIHENMLYSLVDPERSRLRSVIDVGALECLDAREWAVSSNSDWRRLFVQLLIGALRDDLWTQGVRYFKDQDVYAFMGRPDEPPRRLKYPNLRVRSTATIVAHYDRTSKNGTVHRYLRHGAFQGRFRFLGGSWYLEITPTYRFTYNGKDLDWYHESLLSGIKRFERNRSVLSQLLIWQAILRAPWTRADRGRLLEFAPLISLPFYSEVNEGALTALDAPLHPPVLDREIEE
jgi:nucleoside phosphorylase